MINVALVDDHVIVRSGFAQLLSLETDMNVVGEFSSVAEARMGLPACKPDVVILDISMADESGLTLLAEIPSGIACVMLSVHDSPAMVEKSLKLGAKGYLSKRCSPDELIQAVRTSASGGCYLTSDIALKLATPSDKAATLTQLTSRENEICQLLARGLDVKSIATELGLSHKTVHVHRANAMDKLAVKNNVELAKLFSQESFLMRNYTITSICGLFMTGCSWFCLWVIAYYFVNDAELAILLFPFALRLGLTLHTRTKYWATIYLAEWGLTIALALQLEQPQWLMVLVASALSIPVVFLAKRYYKGDQNQHLAVLAVVLLVTSCINVLAVGYHVQSAYMAWLASITGGLLVLPMCYLLWHYLFRSPWSPLTSNLLTHEVHFKVRHILLYSVLLIASIFVQTSLPEEFARFAPFCMAIPIIVLAFRYGWQGALLATMLNSIALISARSGVSKLEITDLLLSLSAQTLTGIMLGLAIQKQKALNQKLSGELTRNQTLSRQLIQAEESVRRYVARELHDEIGQNITAIRTQANIIKRVDNVEMSTRCADMIESLSLNVYDTTKHLLSKLRPKMLDDLDLKESVHQLTRDMEFDNHGTHVVLNWQGDYESLSDILQVTVFRLCQEALNNAAKYANATSIVIELSIEDHLLLNIVDNGIGFKAEDCMKGMGVRGMQERVQALGGKMYLYSLNDYVDGTQIAIKLPKE